MRVGRAAAVVDTLLAACLLLVGSYGVARHSLFAGWPCVGFGFVFTGLAFIWVRIVRTASARHGAADPGVAGSSRSREAR